MSGQLSEVAGWDRGTLIQRWKQTFGRPPPPHTHASFLRLALAWQIQAGVRPGHSAKPFAVATKVARRITRIPPSTGTRLIREWQGTTYHVTILDHGFEYQGTRYRSLSAIAKLITGTAWSGPAFFGIGP